MQSLFDLKEEIGKRIEFVVAAAAVAERAAAALPISPETTGIR